MPDFVFLEMANKMPAKHRWQFRNLRSRFLDAAFTEELLSRVHCFANALGWMRLRDRHQLDRVSDATRLRRRSRNLFAHALDIFSDFAHAEL